MFCRRPCLFLPLLLFMRRKTLMRCGEKRCWRFRSLYWLASHVPDLVVSRPRFERLTSQIRTCLVPDSVVSRPAFADKYRACLFSSYWFLKTIAFFELFPHIEVHWEADIFVKFYWVACYWMAYLPLSFSSKKIWWGNTCSPLSVRKNGSSSCPRVVFESQ